MAGVGSPDAGAARALALTRRLLFMTLDPLALLDMSYYTLLGVAENASVEQIRSACHELVAAVNPAEPPLGVTSEGRERAQLLALLLTEVEDCLCEPARRAAYDAERSRGRSSGASGPVTVPAGTANAGADASAAAGPTGGSEPAPPDPPDSDEWK